MTSTVAVPMLPVAPRIATLVQEADVAGAAVLAGEVVFMDGLVARGRRSNGVGQTAANRVHDCDGGDDPGGRTG